MSHSKKKVLSREESNSNFMQNYEVQAEQLKYAVRKEVEEANLIAEAMKSLQRSFKVEESKRKRAEENNLKLREQIKELEAKAKNFKEVIREKRKEAALYTNEPLVDSDSEEEDEELDEDGGDENELQEEDDYEELIKELSGSETQNNASKLQIINESFSQSLKEKQRQEKQMNHHKELIKIWLKREKQLGKITSPRQKQQKGKSKVDASKFETSLFEFAAEEDVYSLTMNNIFKNYITPLLTVIPSYELNAIFSNFVPLITIQSQFKDKLNKFIDNKCSFHDITSFLEMNSTAYQEYVDNRELASKSLENLLENLEITHYFKEKFNMVNAYEEMSILLDSPIFQLCKYANQFATILEYVEENKVEFEYIATALAVIKRILQNSRCISSLLPPPGKASLIELQNQFDWRNKGGSFVEPHRLFHDSEILRKRSKKSKDKYKIIHFYLFNDAILFVRKFSSKLLFKTFIPIENSVVWDIPDCINSKEHAFQIVNCESGKKYTFVVEAIEIKERILRNCARAFISFNPYILEIPSCLPLL